LEASNHVPKLDISGPVGVDVFILVLNEKLSNDTSCFFIELCLCTTEYFELVSDFLFRELLDL